MYPNGSLLFSALMSEIHGQISLAVFSQFWISLLLRRQRQKQLDRSFLFSSLVQMRLAVRIVEIERLVGFR